MQYILECIAFQLVFLIIYDFFLKQETFFQWNRVYLIVTYIASLVIPWIKIEALQTEVSQKLYEYPEFLWETQDAIIMSADTPIKSSFEVPWEYMLLFGGMLFALFYFGYKLYQLSRLKKQGEIQYYKDFTQVPDKG